MLAEWRDMFGRSVKAAIQGRDLPGIGPAANGLFIRLKCSPKLWFPWILLEYGPPKGVSDQITCQRAFDGFQPGHNYTRYPLSRRRSVLRKEAACILHFVNLKISPRWARDFGTWRFQHFRKDEKWRKINKIGKILPKPAAWKGTKVAEGKSVPYWVPS